MNRELAVLYDTSDRALNPRHYNNKELPPHNSEDTADSRINAAVPVEEIVPTDETKQPESGFYVNPRYLAMVIIGILLLYFSISSLPDNKPAAAPPRPLTLREVVGRLSGVGYRIIAGTILGSNETYHSAPITSDNKLVIVGSQDFTYQDNYSVPQEVVVKNGQILEIKSTVTLNKPLIFTVRGLSAQTKIVLLRKTGNGIDLFGELLKPVQGATIAVTEFATMIFRIIMIVMGLLGLTLIIWGVVKILSGQPSIPPPSEKKQDEEPVFNPELRKKLFNSRVN